MGAMTEAGLRAECEAAQEAAGFKKHGCWPWPHEVKCEHCGALGLNTGWGWWAFTCGAEVLSDGHVDVPCPKEG